MNAVRTPSGFVDVEWLGDIAYKANSPKELLVEKSGCYLRNLFVELIGSHTITTTTDGTIVTRNPGTLVENFALVLPNGKTLKEGRLLDWEDRGYVFGYGGPKVVADTLAANTTEVIAAFHIPFNPPFMRDPHLCSLDMMDVGVGGKGFKKFWIRINWGDENRICKKGASTVSSWGTEPVLRIWAEVSRDSLPTKRNVLYFERGTDSAALGTAANTSGLLIQPERSILHNYHHHILVAEDDTGSGFVNRAKVSTALNDINVKQSGEMDYPTEFLKTPFPGSVLQYEFAQRWDRNLSNLTGIYPILFPSRMDGLATYCLKTVNMTRYDIQVKHSGFTTNGYIRRLDGWLENMNLW